MIRSIEEELELRKSQRQAGELTKFDKEIIGGETLRLEVPFRDVTLLKRALRDIRGFCETSLLCVEQWEDSMPQRAILSAIKDQAKIMNSKLRHLRGAGRPPKLDSGND